MTDNPYRTNNPEAALRYQVGYYQSTLRETAEAIVGISSTRGIAGLDRLNNKIEKILGRDTESFEAEAADLHQRAKQRDVYSKELIKLRQDLHQRAKQRDAYFKELIKLRQEELIKLRQERLFTTVGHWLDDHPWVTWPVLILLVAFIAFAMLWGTPS